MSRASASAALARANLQVLEATAGLFAALTKEIWGHHEYTPAKWRRLNRVLDRCGAKTIAGLRQAAEGDVNSFATAVIGACRALLDEMDVQQIHATSFPRIAAATKRFRTAVKKFNARLEKEEAA